MSNAPHNLSQPALEQAGRTALLLLGDVLTLVIFVVIGRADHQMQSTSPVSTVLNTVEPFLIAWLAAAALFGLYQPQNTQGARSAATQAALGWLVALPLAQILRALLLGRVAALAFWIISFLVAGAMLIAWRALFGWLMARK